MTSSQTTTDLKAVADAIRAQFSEAVNMTASELEKWLDSDESQSVGQKGGGSGESTGHESGRRIVELLHTKKADLTDDDLAHMKKVHGYVPSPVSIEPFSIVSLDH